MREYQRAYYARNGEQLRKVTKARRDSDKEAARKAGRVYYEKNKERMQLQNRANAKKNYNPVRARTQGLKKRYGLTVEQYKVLLAKQKGRCPICQKLLKDEGKYQAIDHCHKTRIVRGILCRGCNFGLGVFKSVANLERALEYLKSLEIFDSEG
jgi:hypothetical protein